MSARHAVSRHPTRSGLAEGVRRARACARQMRRSFAAWLASALLAALALGLAVAPARPVHAEPRQAMPGLDDQVQDIKSDVLGIATELQQLEEKLLYPSDTQVSVFVKLAEGETLELDAVEILIDGEPVARHVYEFKEVEALRKGGVQRVYTGNVATGEHRIEVSLSGRLPGGSSFAEAEGFAFRKEVGPKVIDLSVSGGLVGGVQIGLGEG